jgi:hypothetical protein
MERYANRSGSSGVSSFEIGSTYISVLFRGNPRIYTYSYYGGAGQNHVENIKSLAKNGFGLNSYINTYVKFKYDK